MEIGQVIRKYRKEKYLTQEEMANCLGVTVPAVSKWETGSSYPDIALLAPIARLLGISTDMLLSYKEDLSDKEINQLIETAILKIKSEGYDAGYTWAEKQMQEYPNCGKFIVMMTQTLDNYRYVVRVADPEQYDGRICAIYTRFLDSMDDMVAQTAAMSLFYFSMQRKNYDIAQKCLDKIPKNVMNPKQMQAFLFQAQGKLAEAYKCFEELAYFGYVDISIGLNGIQGLSRMEGNPEKAERMEQKLKALMKIMEIGVYVDTSAMKEALRTKNKEIIFDVLSKLILNIKNKYFLEESELYPHLSFSETAPENVGLMLKKCFEDDKELDFIKEDTRYKKLMEELKSIKGKA
ncbi:helix-turn-helix domain-containing protein [Frisingicoccus caecimuris]|uniref:Transcriptional regulator with XRE-family HTH domain n=1 Tax=Frisingicoccus caecimuris TaxID=1796636 RepID=A0A4R2LKF0_9FIRM|nr:helix-turn-helix transcriptional regulator [Frisingicoccus caecimuris]MCR1917661.1 helix-turn-helix domain-containing protein [Frisingicoccus caecimuris]TCO85932.1 transcriptional regulator with XRE-family HTH domain [Frisingicoccus caecimuris]